MPLLLPMGSYPPLILSGPAAIGTNVPTPVGYTGVWVTLLGQGGISSIGTFVSNTNQNCSGGDGGGGGARIGRSFIPISELDSTYSLVNNSESIRFSSGSILWIAGWGNHIQGGIASASGYTTDVYLANGGRGGDGGGPNGSGISGTSVTNGAGGGGGGGGGARSGPQGGGKSGGSGGTSTGGDPAGFAANGGHGAGGAKVGSNGAQGGRGCCGSGRTIGTTTTVGASGVILEWV